MTIPVHIKYATESDADAIGKIHTLSFLNSPFTVNAFPNAGVTDLQRFHRVGAFKHMANPQMHILAGVEPTTGEIVGYSRWLIPTAVPVGYNREQEVILSDEARAAAADQLQFAPKTMNERVWTAFRSMIEERRKAYVRDGDMSMLFFFAPLHPVQLLLLLLPLHFHYLVLVWGRSFSVYLLILPYFLFLPSFLPSFIYDNLHHFLTKTRSPRYTVHLTRFPRKRDRIRIPQMGNRKGRQGSCAYLRRSHDGRIPTVSEVRMEAD